MKPKSWQLFPHVRTSLPRHRDFLIGAMGLHALAVSGPAPHVHQYFVEVYLGLFTVGLQSCRIAIISYFPVSSCCCLSSHPCYVQSSVPIALSPLRSMSTARTALPLAHCRLMRVPSLGPTCRFPPSSWARFGGPMAGAVSARSDLPAVRQGPSPHFCSTALPFTSSLQPPSRYRTVIYIQASTRGHQTPEMLLSVCPRDQPRALAKRSP